MTYLAAFKECLQVKGKKRIQHWLSRYSQTHPCGRLYGTGSSLSSRETEFLLLLRDTLLLHLPFHLFW